MTRRGPARFWLLVAAALAASAAFGIHPEPPSAISDGTLEISGAAADSPIAPHDCLACRAHRPLVTGPAAVPVAAPERSDVRRALARTVSLRSVVLPPAAGRAPPASA